MKKTIGIPQYIEGYVNVEEFLECRRVCDNFDRKWSCPPYDFEPVRDYWEKFTHFHVIGKKMILEEEDKDNWKNLMKEVKQQLDRRTLLRRKEISGQPCLMRRHRICGENNCKEDFRENLPFSREDAVFH